MGGYSDHFGDIAKRYDRLRDEARPDVLRALADLGDLPERSLLDVACGTGAMAEALARDHRARPAAAIDASPEMVDIARGRLEPLGADVRVARAEELPFADTAFERILMTTAVHLLDRPRAFAEAHRVLGPGGRLVIGTIDPAGARKFWLADLFPSYAEIDGARFPAPPALVAELRAAGFGEVAIHPRPAVVSYPREAALEKLRGRFASSFALMTEEEIAAGVARAERELPATVETEIARVFLVAAR